jgi:hypothetical protein
MRTVAREQRGHASIAGRPLQCEHVLDRRRPQTRWPSARLGHGFVRLELGKGDAPTVSRGSKPINPPITNPLKRFNKEIGRRTDVVGIFPDDRSLIRLPGMLCIEQDDVSLVGRAYLSAESISMCLAVQAEYTEKEIKEVPELQPA